MCIVLSVMMCLAICTSLFKILDPPIPNSHSVYKCSLCCSPAPAQTTPDPPVPPFGPRVCGSAAREPWELLLASEPCPRSTLVREPSLLVAFRTALCTQRHEDHGPSLTAGGERWWWSSQCDHQHLCHPGTALRTLMSTQDPRVWQGRTGARIPPITQQ